MKKRILSITTIILLSIAAKAQAPDFGFETWSNVALSTTIQDPTGWASLNTLNSLGTGTALSVTKVTSPPTDVYANTASAKIQTVKINGASIPNPYRAGKNLDTAGILAIGNIIISPPGIKYGAAYAKAPTVLSFACKYTPQPGDSAFVLAFLTKKNTLTGKSDIIATGKYETGVNTSAYSVKNINMTYLPGFANAIPDSQQIYISSSIYSHFGAKVGSTFYVDAFVWSAFVGIDDKGVIDRSVSVFPNPSNGQVHFNSSVNANSVELMDVTGRFINRYTMMNNKLTIETGSFVPGSYLYNVLNDKKEVISRGKFEVIK